MALTSGTKYWYVKNTNNNVRVRFTWSQDSKDYQTNTSTCSYAVAIRHYANGWDKNVIGNATIGVDAQSNTVNYKTVKMSTATGGDGSGYHTVLTGTTKVTHNTDGTCALTWALYFQAEDTWDGSPAYLYTADTSFTVSLEANDRYATITAANNFNDNENPSITYYNPMGANVGALQAAIAVPTSTGVEFCATYRDITKSVNGTYTFNLTTAERDLLLSKAATSNTLGVIFYVLSTVNGTNYTQTINKTMTVVDANPQIVFSAQDIDTTTRELTGDTATKAIAGYSDMKITVTPTAQKKATITSIQVKSGDKTVTQEIGGYVTFENIKSADLSITVTDSRGNSNSVNTSFDLIPYTPITCQVDVESVDFASDEVATSNFVVSGVLYNNSFGRSPNQFRGSYRYNIDGGTFTDWISMSPTKTSTSYSQTISITADYNSIIELEVNVSDALESIIQSFSSRPTPVFDWGEDDFNFNVPVTIKGDTVPSIVEQGTSGIWTYRKWSDGVGECWGKKDFTVNVTSQWGSMYTSGAISGSNISFPYGLFAETPVVNASLLVRSAGGILMAPGGAGSNIASIDQTGVYEIARGTSLSNAAYTINYDVKGRWK